MINDVRPSMQRFVIAARLCHGMVSEPSMVLTSTSLAAAETLAHNMTITTTQVVILSIHGYFGQTGAFMYPHQWLVNSPTCVCAYVASTIEGSLLTPAGALCRGARSARHRRAGCLHSRSGGHWSVLHTY